MSVKLYLAGKMSGLVDNGKSEFEYWSTALRNAGYEVLSPHEFEQNLDPQIVDQPLGAPVLAGFLRFDLGRLSGCDGIALIPNWTDSVGANIEVHVARLLDLNVHEAADWIHEPTLAWYTAGEARPNMAMVLKHLVDLGYLGA